MHTTNDISYQLLAAYMVRGRVVIANVDQGCVPAALLSFAARR